MRDIDNRRKLTRSALVALVLWLAVVVGVVFWQRPAFWESPADRFSRAETLASGQRWAEALVSVNAALASQPDNAGYLVFKGYRQLDLDDNDGAHATFSRALAIDGTNVDAKLGAATALVRQGRTDAALAMLQRLSTDSLDAGERHRRSQLYSRLEARHLALQDLAILLSGDPGNPIYLKDAAELALMVEEWERAESLLQRLEWATLDPDVRLWIARNRAGALEAAGGQAVAAGRHLDAASRYGALADMRPDEPKFRRAQAHALRTAGRLAEAEAAFRELVAQGAADASVRTSYAWLLNTQRRYAEAWAVVEPLPRPSPDQALLELQTWTAIWAGQTEESVQLIRALLTRRPDDAELWRRLGQAWHRLRDERQAAEALAASVRLQSHDARTRELLAQILTMLGSLDEATEHYSELIAGDPHNPDYLRALGLIQETAGDLGAAADSYRHALEASPDPVPELWLRLARLHRWMKRPQDAVPWYEQYLAGPGDLPLRRAAAAELALSLYESGDAAAAAARLRRLDGGPLQPEEIVLAARAATDTAEPASAAKYLELLSDSRPLTGAEQMWLAGQYRAAGDRARALAAYERASASMPEPGAELLEALGDLYYDTGNFEAALRAFEQVPDGGRVSLKLARTAARAGRLSLASETYERYTGLRPDDLDGRLEAARYLASAGRPQLAIAHYQAFVDARGPADLRLELARVHLAAQRFDAAEEWARQAVAAGDRPEEAGLALAQSLHLQGRHREARTILVDLLHDAASAPRAREWQGYVAVALDRHLEAFRSFARAVEGGAADPAALRLSQGTAALKRGDYARALEAYTAAAAAGAMPAPADAARRQLRAATLPMAFAPVWGVGDSNGVGLAQAGGGAVLFLPSLAGRVELLGASGRVSQRAFSTGASSASLAVSQLFPTPALELGLGVGLHAFDRAPDLATWKVGGLYHFTDEATVGVEAARQTLLPMDPSPELRQFNRVLDLRAIGPAFRTDVVRVTTEVAARDVDRARVEAGLERFQDGNRRRFLYLHYQIPTESSARAWTAVRPNVFFETFRDTGPFYFSPKRHATVGTMLHVIRRYTGWQLESEINPQLLRTDGKTGVGGHGLLSIGGRLKGVALTGGGFVFWDGLEDHLQWRVGGRVDIPLSR